MTLHTTTSADGTPIGYEKSGDGPPVVLVNGALCTRKADEPLAALLAGRFTVHTYDRRGRGDSGDATAGQIPPKDVADREVEDLAAVISEAGGTAAVYGISSGAALALRAAWSGLPVTRVVAYEPPYRPAESSDEEHAAHVARMYELVGAGDRRGAVAHFVSDMMPPEAIDAWVNSPEFGPFAAVAPTLAYDYHVMGDGLAPVERLAAVAVPVLACSGGESMDFMRDAARAVAGAVPDGRYRSLAGQSHEVAPEAMAAVLAEFFAG